MSLTFPETSSQVNETLNDLITGIDATKLDDINCVSFAGRGLKLNTEEDAQEIVNEILACTNMTTINLEGNTLGIEAAKAIGKALVSKTMLVNALLKDMFTGRLKTEIPEAITHISAGIIKSNARLTILDLSDNAFGPIGMRALLPFLQSEACRELQILRLNNNGLGTEGGRLLSLALKDMRTLKVFYCGRNRLEMVGSIALGNALAELSTLESIEMPQNGIKGEGIEAIAKAVLANKGIKVVNLNDNNLKGRGGQAISDALSQSSCLEVVNFGDCLLKRPGCLLVCEALEACGNLENMKEIHLNGNEIWGSDVLDVLDRMFSGKDRFRVKLDLSCNNFGDDVERVKGLFEEKLELHISDDEGDYDEEEEEDNDYDDEEEEEEEEDDEEVDVVGEYNEEKEVAEFNKSNVKIKEKSSSITMNIEDLVKSIEKEYNNLPINALCDEFVNISMQGFDNDSGSLKDETQLRTEILLKTAMKKDSSEFSPMNELLVSLGLLKDENGKYRNVDDLRGPYSALTHSIRLLNATQKQVLRAFMNRPHKATERTGKVKHNLMQALYI